MNKLPKRLIITVVAIAIVLAIVANMLNNIDKVTDSIETKVGDLSVFSYTKKDYNTKSKTLDISPEHPSASAYGTTIDFGQFGLESKETIEINELPEKIDKTNEVKVIAYDYKIGGKTNFDDVITIAIPYDENYTELGAEGECIGAKYYNQTTSEWEGVYYELDTTNKQVLIYTTHLSTYGVFQVKNENTRKAYITDVYAIAALLNTGKSFEVIKELSEEGKPGNAAFEAGFEAINSVVGNTGTALTTITLGGMYEGMLAQTLGSSSQHLGLVLAVVQTCYDFTYNFADDQGKISTLSNLVKNISNNTVGYFGTSAMQVGFAGVAVFDILLSTVQSDMMELKLENIGDVYQYYNDVENPRALNDWRKMFIAILETNSGNPQEAQKLINQEIENFCDRFWNLGYGKTKEIAAVSGKKYSFDERTWTKDRELLTAQYKAYLLNRLQAPITSARKYLLNQAMEQAQKEFEKQLRTIQKELNKTINVQIIEVPEKEGKYKYDGYIVKFAPLSINANSKSWVGKMPSSGELNTSFTVLGHMQSGSPNQLELYEPGKDAPLLRVNFKVSYPITTILLTSQGEEEETEEESPPEEDASMPPSESEEDTGTSPSEKEYAWVLKETKTNDWQEKLAFENKSQEGSWKSDVTASSASATFTHTFTGNTDGHMVKGMSETGEATWTGPSLNIIKSDDEFSLQLDIKHIKSTRKYPQGNWTILAQIFHLDSEGNQSGAASYMSDKDGNTSFTSGSGNNFQSFSSTVYGTFGTGSNEGDQIAIQVSASGASVSVKTSYIYEWKKIDSATPLLDTTGIEGIVDLP